MNKQNDDEQPLKKKKDKKSKITFLFFLFFFGKFRIKIKTQEE